MTGRVLYEILKENDLDGLTVKQLDLLVKIGVIDENLKDLSFIQKTKMILLRTKR